MATKKISELEAITEADDSDVLAIVDVSEGKTNKITKNNLLIGAGHSIEMSLNQETYALTLTLKNAAGTELSTASIDLPNENAITNIEYSNGKLTLTKQSGTTTEVDITGLINGLVTESDFETFTTQLNQVLQSLDETKADAEDVEALQTRVTELEQENEDLKKNQLTYTPTPATSHYLKDSADSRFRKFLPIGRTTQESTTGKQLFNANNIPSSTQIVVEDEGKTIKMPIATSGNGGVETGKTLQQLCPILQVGDTVYLYFDRNLGNTSNPIIYLVGSIGEWGMNIAKTITQEMLDSTVILYGNRYISGETGQCILTDFRIVKNSTDQWERYTGGEPAPNPKYPIDIKNTGDNVNLFDKSQVLQNYELRGATAGDEKGQVQPQSGWFVSDFIEVKQNTTYYLSGNKTSGTANALYDENKNCISIITAVKGAITTTDNTKYVRFNGLLNELDNNIKLEQGTKATPYSPYGCGNVNEKVDNKNKFDSEDWYNTLHNINNNAISKETINGIEYYKFKRANETVGKYPYMKGKFKENTQYVISARALRYNNEATSTGFSIHYTDGTFQDTYIRETIEYDYIVISQANKTIDYICLSYANSYSALIRNIQLEENTAPTSYVPHSEQNPSFPLAQGQKFMEGSYPDDDEKVHHKMRKVVINGSESGWIKYNDNEYYTTSVLQDAKKGTSAIYGYCDKVKREANGQIKYSYLSKSNNNLGLDIKQVSTYWGFTGSTVEELKQWLSENPIEIEYELAEEQTEDFTEEQKTAWKEIKKARTYKGGTIISSEDETPANLEVEYVQDTKTYIDNKVTALTNAIISLGGNV